MYTSHAQQLPLEQFIQHADHADKKNAGHGIQVFLTIVDSCDFVYPRSCVQG